MEYSGGNYTAVDSQGKAVYTNTNASAVANFAVKNGKSVMLVGKIVLTAPIDVENSSVTISGINVAGDLFFTNDIIYHGFSNKWGTVIIAEGIDAFEVGKTNFVFGVTIQNLGISGKDNDEATSSTVYSPGSGIDVDTANTLTIRNVQVNRKQYGINLNPETFVDSADVIDNVNLENILLDYNVYGVWSANWVADLRARNIFGYINQLGLLHCSYKYDWILENIFSNGDAWASTSVIDTPIYFEGSKDLIMQNVEVGGEANKVLCPQNLIYLYCGKSGNDAYAHYTLENLRLFETNKSGVAIDGTGGDVQIRNIYCGTPDGVEKGFLGGAGTVTLCAVQNGQPNLINVSVDGGHVECSSPQAFWFLGCLGRVSNVKGYNPYGKIATPFSDSAETVGMYFPNDASSNVTSGVTYTVVQGDILVYSTGGSVASITIFDANGDVLENTATTLTARYIPMGYKIMFSFSAQPTVKVYSI